MSEKREREKKKWAKHRKIPAVAQIERSTDCAEAILFQFRFFFFFCHRVLPKKQNACIA